MQPGGTTVGVFRLRISRAILLKNLILTPLWYVLGGYSYCFLTNNILQKDAKTLRKICKNFQA